MAKVRFSERKSRVSSKKITLIFYLIWGGYAARKTRHTGLSGLLRAAAYPCPGLRLQNIDIVFLTPFNVHHLSGLLHDLGQKKQATATAKRLQIGCSKNVATRLKINSILW